METRTAYTFNLAEKIGFNINSTYICMYVFVRMHVCGCGCVYIYIYIIIVYIIYNIHIFFVYIHICKLEYLSRYAVSMLFVCLFACKDICYSCCITPPLWSYV